MESVQFQIVPCSSLYLFSRTIGPLQCTVSINYRILVCCTCCFQSSSFFILASSVCQSLQCQISALTQRDEGGHLLRFSCVVGRETLQTNVAAVCGECLQCMDHTGFVCPMPRWHVLPTSTLLRLQGALQGHRRKWALHFVPFPGQSHSGSWVLCKGSDVVGVCVLCPVQV